MAWATLLRGAVSIGKRIFQTPTVQKALKKVVRTARPALRRTVATAARTVKKTGAVVSASFRKSVPKITKKLKSGGVITGREARKYSKSYIAKVKKATKNFLPPPLVQSVKYLNRNPVKTTIAYMGAEAIYNKVAKKSTPVTYERSQQKRSLPNVNPVAVAKPGITKYAIPAMVTGGMMSSSKAELIKRGLAVAGLSYGAEQLAEMAGVRGGAGFIGAREGSYDGSEVVKSWSANGTPFQKLASGHIVVTRKDGTVKKYKPYRPIVFGKTLNAKKLARVAKKHRGVYKELHKLFGKRTVRRK